MPSVLERPSIHIDRTLWDSLKDLRQKFINRTVPPLFVDYVNGRVGIGKIDADFPLDVHVVSNFRQQINGIGFLMSDNCAIGGYLSLGDVLMVNGDILTQRGLQVHEKAWLWGGISIVGGGDLNVDTISTGRLSIGRLNADFPLDISGIANFRDLIQGRGFLMTENCTIGGFLSLGDNLLVNGDVLIQRGLQCHERAWFWGGISVTGGTIDIDNVVLTSPNGTRFRLTVDNEGVLITTQL